LVKAQRKNQSVEKKTCELQTGLKGRPTRRHIDDLKNYDPGDAVIKDCKMNDEGIEKVRDTIGDTESADIGHQNLNCNTEDEWKDKVININNPVIKNPPKMGNEIKEMEFKALIQQCRT